METGTRESSPGPFLRVSNADPSDSTAWWFQYLTQGTVIFAPCGPLSTTKMAAGNTKESCQ